MTKRSVNAGRYQVQMKINDKRMKKIFNELKFLEKAYTLVGIQEGNSQVKGLLVSQIAFWNEFGTKHIPERSFIRAWFDSNISTIQQRAHFLYGKVLDGKMNAKTALATLGQWVQDRIRKSILEFTSPPNAPMTIRRKGSSHPLIDTGQMLNSIHHTEHYGKPIPPLGATR